MKLAIEIKCMSIKWYFSLDTIFVVRVYFFKEIGKLNSHLKGSYSKYYLYSIYVGICNIKCVYYKKCM